MGALFPFLLFQSPGTSPVSRDFSDATESGSAPHQPSRRSLGWISSGPTDLHTFSSPRRTQTSSAVTVGRNALLSPTPRASGSRQAREARPPAKTEAKLSLSTSAFAMAAHCLSSEGALSSARLLLPVELQMRLHASLHVHCSATGWGCMCVRACGCTQGWGHTRVCAVGEQTAVVPQGEPHRLLLLPAAPRRHPLLLGAPSRCCRCFGGVHFAPCSVQARVDLSLVTGSSVPPPVVSHWSAADLSRPRWTLIGQMQLCVTLWTLIGQR